MAIAKSFQISKLFRQSRDQSPEIRPDGTGRSTGPHLDLRAKTQEDWEKTEAAAIPFDSIVSTCYGTQNCL